MEYVGNGEHWRPKHPLHVSNNDCGDYSIQYRIVGELPYCTFESVILFKGEIIYRGEDAEISKLWDELVFDITFPKQECTQCLKKDVQIAKLECISRHGDAKNVEEFKRKDHKIREVKDIAIRLWNAMLEYEKGSSSFQCPQCGNKYDNSDRKLWHEENCWIGKAMTEAKRIL